MQMKQLLPGKDENFGRAAEAATAWKHLPFAIVKQEMKDW